MPARTHGRQVAGHPAGGRCIENTNSRPTVARASRPCAQIAPFRNCTGRMHVLRLFFVYAQHRHSEQRPQRGRKAENLPRPGSSIQRCVRGADVRATRRPGTPARGGAGIPACHMLLFTSPSSRPPRARCSPRIRVRQPDLCSAPSRRRAPSPRPSRPSHPAMPAPSPSCASSSCPCPSSS